MTERETDDHTRAMLLCYFDDPVELDDLPEPLAQEIVDQMESENLRADQSASRVHPIHRPPPAPHRVRVRGSWLLAVACVLVAMTATGVVMSRSAPSTPDQQATVLDPLEDRGTAEVSLDPEAPAGDASFVLSVDGVPVAEDEYLELWLLGGADDAPVSLGKATNGTHSLPRDVDLSRFSTLDVSVERFDGEVGHSGRSLFRGDLGMLV